MVCFHCPLRSVIIPAILPSLMSIEKQTLRYIPQGRTSLSSDAPGWSAYSQERIRSIASQDGACVNSVNSVNNGATERHESDDHDSVEHKGPICWKCKGKQSLPLRAQDLLPLAGTSSDFQSTFTTLGKKKQKRLLRTSHPTQAPPVNNNTSSSSNNSSIEWSQGRRPCPVCKSKGYLPVRFKYIQSLHAMAEKPFHKGGSITARRRRPRGWKEFGHVPPVIQALLAQSDNTHTSDTLPADKNTLPFLSLLSQANGHDHDYHTRRKDVTVTLPTSEPHPTPPWLPIHPGEQLCNLVGRWRILQRIASHRWTTDDLVTAYVAASTFVSLPTSSKSKDTIRYLDLGTGNGSVLQMVTWYLLSHSSQPYNSVSTIEAIGVEARSEAVQLARRSLSFNLDPFDYWEKVIDSGRESNPDHSTTVAGNANSINCTAHIIQGDFRDLVSMSHVTTENMPSVVPNKELELVAAQRYDLITGTPPYFRVDFITSSPLEYTNGRANGDTSPTAAIIQQGGMPTSMQSAPARCEFRGGVEVYCQAAFDLLAEPHGIFVVCENWQNNDRVWRCAKEVGFVLIDVWPIMGKVGKKDPLFAVYVMKKGWEKDEREMSQRGHHQHVPLAVRDESGTWTKEYMKVLQAMSIPVV